MLGTATTQSSSKHRLACNQSRGLEPSGKRQKVDSDSFLERVRSLVQPLQVQAFFTMQLSVVGVFLLESLSHPPGVPVIDALLLQSLFEHAGSLCVDDCEQP